MFTAQGSQEDGCVCIPIILQFYLPIHYPFSLFVANISIIVRNQALSLLPSRGLGPNQSLQHQGAHHHLQAHAQGVLLDPGKLVCLALYYIEFGTCASGKLIYSRSPARKDNRRRSSSSSRSRSPRRRGSRSPPRKRSPTPQPTILHVDKLTRNVNKEHLEEIFGTFGTVKNVEVGWDRRVNLPRGFAYVEYETHEPAEKARQYMDGVST